MAVVLGKPQPPNITITAHSDNIDQTRQSVAGDNVSGTILGYPSSAETLAIASTSTDDDNGGTGALTVRVTYLTDAFAVVTEDVTLDGQTKVAFATDAGFRVIGIEVLTAGTGGTNAGDLMVAANTDTFTAGVPTNPYAVAPAGHSLAHDGMYTVPAGKRLLLHEIFWESDASKVLTVYLEWREGASAPWKRREWHTKGSTVIDLRSFPVGPEDGDAPGLAEGWDLRILAQAGSNDAVLAADLLGRLV